jgi:dCTP deaminase
VRTAELGSGVMVAVARDIPEPPNASATIDLRTIVPDEAWTGLQVGGPTVESAIAGEWPTVSAWLTEAQLSPSYYRSKGELPWAIAEFLPGVHHRLGVGDHVRGKGERHRIPIRIEVDADLAWLLGMYVAEGHRRDGQISISNTDPVRLDRLAATFGRLGLPVHRAPGAVTCSSKLLSRVFVWLGIGGHAPTKRAPAAVFGWPTPLVEAFLEGLVDGDGSVDDTRTSVWTTSSGLVSDVLLLFARLGRRAGSTCKATANLPLWQVYAPHNEHKLLTTVPLPDGLFRRLRTETGLSQAAASRRAGYSHASDLNNLERGRNRDAVRFATIRRLSAAYAAEGVDTAGLDRLVEGGLAWDRVVEVVDTGDWEPIFDLEVRPDGRRIQNFLAGRGGVFASNTAGFIDAGFDGHITLELSNVANLPITLYPGMKIGQISFLRMTTPADVPYGEGALRSKYQGQRGPTPSRYWENFEGS